MMPYHGVQDKFRLKLVVSLNRITTHDASPSIVFSMCLVPNARVLLLTVSRYCPGILDGRLQLNYLANNMAEVPGRLFSMSGDHVVDI